MDIVDRDAWRAARVALLDQEKALARQRDEVVRMRQALPAVKVNNSYQFESESGTVGLSELFADKTQLVIYHFMFAPGWQEGCKSCSFWADHYDSMTVHLAARDVALAVVSRAPLQDFLPFKSRMGWQFNWVSSHGSTFNEDFQIYFPDRRGEYNYRDGEFLEDMPGLSVLAKTPDHGIVHTYSTYSRGLDPLNPTYQLLDLVPKGRDEQALDYPMSWIRLHDEY